MKRENFFVIERRMRSFIFLLFSLFFVHLNSFELDVCASSAVVINARTKKVLYRKKNLDLVFPASLTKVATALYILESASCDLERQVEASSLALQKVVPEKKHGDYSLYPPYIIETDGSSSYLITGELLSIKDLLYALLLESGDDAANVLAEAVGGSIEEFMENLNRYLREIGCENTHFLNPHGLHHPEHFSTVSDLALIAQKALDNPLFRQIIATREYEKPKSNKQRARKIKQSNLLLDEGSFYYPHSIGGKTGYTSHAGKNLLAIAEYEGRTLITALVGCRTNEERYVDAIRLFEAAFFEKKESKTLLFKGQSFSKQIPGGKKAVVGELREDLKAFTFPSEEVKMRTFIHWHGDPFPVSIGDCIGEVRVVDEEGGVVTSSLLYAKEKVKKSLFLSFFHLFKKR